MSTQTKKRTKRFTVAELAAEYQVSENWLRTEIKTGRLVAANLSKGSRPNYRIHPDDAEEFWKSLSNARPVKQRKNAAIAATVASGQDFEDFIK